MATVYCCFQQVINYMCAELCKVCDSDAVYVNLKELGNSINDWERIYNIVSAWLSLLFMFARLYATLPQEKNSHRTIFFSISILMICSCFIIITFLYFPAAGTHSWLSQCDVCDCLAVSGSLGLSVALNCKACCPCFSGHSRQQGKAQSVSLIL